MKRQIDKNLQFIWRDLMSQRGRRLTLITTGIVLLGAAVQTAAPYGLGLIISALSAKSVDAFLIGVATYFGLELCSSGIGWFRMRVRERMFQENFWHLPMRLSQLYFSRPLSKLTSEDNEIDGGGVESVKDKVWTIIAAYIYSVVPNYSLALFAAVACFIAHPLAGVVAVLYITLDVFIGTRQNRYMQKRALPIIDEFRLWERRIREWWNATLLIKPNGAEHRIIRQVKDEVQPAILADDALWRVFFPWAVLGRRTFGQVTASMLYLGAGFALLDGTLAIASFVLILFSFDKIKVVLEDINDQHRELGRLIASIDKYRTVLLKPVPFQYNVGITFAAKQIGITCKGVSLFFGEGTARRQILRDVNFTINPGERIGIVGPSGAGKSQLINLIVRGTDPEEGVIYVNETDIRELSLQSYLRFCGIIPQKSDLFEDTVLGNIQFGVSDQDRGGTISVEGVHKRAWDALKKAGLDFGERLSEGLDTKVGYKGMRLSGGQQARMRIADAHFKLAAVEVDRPRLIIADEPTASLDSLSEVAVMEHLTDALPEGTTVLMIAHRLSTVASMDRIMFVRPLAGLSNGESQVTLHTSLRELYEADALFREMADAQNFRP